MCWGQNWDGQFGNSALPATYSLTPVTSDATLTDAISISAGQAHTCALRSSGTVACWGANGPDGQIGDGTKTPRPTPTLVTGLSGVTALASAAYFNCALASGTAWCWGTTPLGKYANATQVSALSGLKAIATGAKHACAVKSDGTVVCWGANNLDQLGAGSVVLSGGTYVPNNGVPASSSAPIVVQTPLTTSTKADLTGVIFVTAGSAHSCALLSDQTVKCWGDNTNGAIGSASQSPWPAWAAQTGAIKVDGLAGVTQLASGQAFNCALLSDKTVKCWGDNTYGQLGDNSTTKRLTPVSVSGLANVTAIATGEAHACALLDTGDIKCWGANGLYGNLGNNSTSPGLTPVSTAAGAVFWH